MNCFLCVWNSNCIEDEEKKDALFKNSNYYVSNYGAKYKNTVKN